MKLSLRILGAAAVLWALQVAPANATLITYGAHLSGANENPVNNSTAFGSIIVVLDDVANTLLVNETFSGLSAPAAAAHIHCCQPAGVNAGVVLGFSQASGFPVGFTSGTYLNKFDLAVSLAGISVANFIAGLNAGTAYANIHNATFPGGEIRGQLMKVPEPATLALFGLGALGLGFFRRKRA